MNKHLFFLYFLSIVPVSLLSMESNYNHIINLLRTNEIRANAQKNQFSPYPLSCDEPWSIRTLTSGHYDYIPNCLINNKSSLYNGKKMPTKKTIRNADCFCKSPNGLYQATITTTSAYNDTVIISFTPLFANRPHTTKICFSPSSTHLITGGNGGLHLWNIKTKKMQQSLNGHIGSISTIEFNNSGTKMLTSSHLNKQSAFILWDTSDINNIRRIKKTTISCDIVFDAVFSSSDDRIAISTIDGQVIFMDGKTGNIINKNILTPDKFSHNIYTHALFTPDNAFCITGTSFGNRTSAAFLWDAHHGTKLATLCTADTEHDGIGLTPDGRSVIVALQDPTQNSALVIDLFSLDAQKCLDYLINDATAQEKHALYLLYCAYKDDAPSSCIPQSVFNGLPQNVIINYFIKKHLLLTHHNNTMVQLSDGSKHSFAPHEVEACTVLLQKKITRAKITPELITKWGHDISAYEQLEIAPLYVYNLDIDSDKCILLKQFLCLNSTQFKKKYSQLTETERDLLLFMASKKGFGIPTLLAHIYEEKLLPEVIKEYLTPHFSLKNIIDHLRNTIIKHNAKSNTLTKKKAILPLDHSQWRLLFNQHLSKYMLVPHQMIHNHSYLFSGRLNAYPPITLNGQDWTPYVHITNNILNISYYLTQPFPDKECTSENLSSIIPQMILWTLNSKGAIINKKLLACDGKYDYIKFSPNGHLLALASSATVNYPHNELNLISFSMQQDGPFFNEMRLPNISRKITALCFDASSTLLAIGTEHIPNSNEKNISIRDVNTGQELYALSSKDEHIVHFLRFNNAGTRLFSVSYYNDTYQHSILWDITDASNVQKISSHLIVNDGISHPYFSRDDKTIITTQASGDLMFLDGVTGDIITYNERDHHGSCQYIASTLNNDNTLLVSAQLTTTQKSSKGNTLLWDARTGTVLATILSDEIPVHGVGFTPDKRHIITTGHAWDQKTNEEFCYITTTELFDENTHKALKYIKHDTSLSQKYVLYSAFDMQQKNGLTSLYKQLLLHTMREDNAEEKTTKLLIKEHL